MSDKTFDQIVQEIKGEKQPKTMSLEMPNLGLATKTKEGLQIVRPVRYDTPFDTAYDRLSDGSYVAKFENRIGATGNEDRLARQQSTGEKWSRGGKKFAMKSVNYATDAIFGTIYGIGSAIGSGDWSKLYDNDFSNAMDDINKKMDNNLANYYSDEEKSQSFLKSMTTANFWANDVTGGLAFVAGAVLPEIALGALTGGATVAGGLGKAAFKFGAKKVEKEVIEASIKRGVLGSLGEAIGFSQGRRFTKQLMQAKLGNRLGSAVDTGIFIARTSNFEAGMEARQNLKESVDSFYRNFEENNGRVPSLEEASTFMDDARKAANGVYTANMAILSVSNAVMFGQKLLPTSLSNSLGKVKNFGNNLIGLGTKSSIVDGKIVYTMAGANKAQKLTGNLYKTLRKPLTEGLYEEGFQGVAGKTMQDYLENKYDPNSLDGYSAWASLHDAVNEQYTTNEGWKEMSIGMIIGFIGGGVNPKNIKNGTAFSGFGKNSRKFEQRQKEKGLERVNKGLDTLASLNRVSALQSAVTNKDRVGGEFETTLSHFNFLSSQEGINTPSEAKADFDTTIDALDFSESTELGKALAESGMTAEEYKNTLKTEFDNNLKLYKSAKSGVEALGLDRTLKDTVGNRAEIAEAVKLQLMLGMASMDSATKFGEQLDAIVGTKGILNSIDFYSGLREESAQKVDELRESKAKLSKLKSKAIKASRDLAELDMNAPQETLNKRRDEASRKAVLEQQAIIETQARIDQLTQELEGEKIATGFDLDGVPSTSETSSVLDIIGEIERLQTYTDSLRAEGREKDAKSIEYLVGQVKAHTDSYREMMNMHRNMLETNFFSKKEGKSFLSKVLGKKYTMSEEFKKQIEDGNEKIDKSLNLVGIRDYDTVQELIKSEIEDNENLSEREKFRYESIIRLQLGGVAMQNIADRLESTSESITAEKVEKPSPLEGDTIALRESLNLTEQDLNNIQKLDKAIKEITDQLDFIVTSRTANTEEINKLKEELENLKKQKDDYIEQQANEVNARQQADNVETVVTAVQTAEDKGAEIGRNTTVEAVLTEEQRNNLNKARKGEKAEPAKTLFTSLEDLLKNSKSLLGKKFNVRGIEVEFLDYRGEVLTGAGQRVFVKVLINGIPVTFYSSTGSGKKSLQEGIFYPTLGIESDERFNGTWINKIDGTEMASYYNSASLAVVGAFIDSQFGNTNSFASQINQNTNDLQNPKREALTKERGLEIRKEYNKEYLNSNRETFSNNERSKVVEAFDNLVQEINAKYDAGLTTLRQQTTDTEITEEEYQNFVGNGVVSEERLNSIANKIKDGAELNDKETAIFTNKTEEINNILKAQKDKIDSTLSQSLDDAKVEVDQLIQDRIDKYGLPVFNLFTEITESIERVISRAKNGLPVDTVSLKEAIDKLHAVYKEATRLKQEENTVERTQKNLTTEYLNAIQQEIETELNYLIDYETSLKTGEAIPTFEYSSESTNTTIETSTEEGTPTRDSQESEQIAQNLEESVQQNNVFTETEQDEKVNTLLEELDAQIESLEKQIANLERGFKIVNSEDYKRYTKLLKKRESQGLSQIEKEEIKNLKKELDHWVLLTGTVVEGFTLTDLIQQREVLAETQVLDRKEVEVVETQDVLESVEIPDKNGRANYAYGQSYDRVFASFKDGNIIIHHMKEEEFEEIIDGIVDEDGNKITYSKDERGNLVVSKDSLKTLNEKTNLRILTETEGVKGSGGHIVVLESSINMQGEEVLTPLKSSFGLDFGEAHDIDAIYEAASGNGVEIIVDLADDYNRKAIAKYKNIVKKEKSKKKLKEARAELRKNLVLQVVDSKGRNIATLKGINSGTINTDSDVKFQNLRNAAIESDEMLDMLLNGGIKGRIPLKVENKDGGLSKPEVSIDHVLLGHPNMNIKEEDGKAVVAYSKIDPKDSDKILDIGYVENGKAITRSGQKVNTIYLKKSIEKDNKKKIPFVVLQRGNQKFAYPVKTTMPKDVDINEFTSIYNSQLGPTDKANALNRFLASNGIDIKQQGNAFISFGTDNLNDSFFNEKVAQLENTEYFYDVEGWIKPDSSIKDIVENQITINIDVNNPIHSPKLRFDYSRLDVKPVKVSGSNTANKKTVDNDVVDKDFDDNFKCS